MESTKKLYISGFLCLLFLVPLVINPTNIQNNTDIAIEDTIIEPVEDHITSGHTIVTRENFDSDVFSGGEWTRIDTDFYVDTPNGYLRSSSDGDNTDGCTWNTSFNLPLVVEWRARLTSGGADYTLPAMNCHTPDIELSVSSATTRGWMIGGWTWTDFHLKNPTGEGIWRVMRFSIAQNGSTLWTREDSESDFTLLFAVPKNFTTSTMKLGFSAPWDSVCDIDYIEVTEGASNLTCYEEDFDLDVFEAGEWSRSNRSIDISSGTLHFDQDSIPQDYATLESTPSLPFVVYTKSRLVSGGGGYVLPIIRIEPDGTSPIDIRCNTTYWTFNDTSFTSPQTPTDENQWWDVMVTVREDGGDLWARNGETEPAWEYVGSITWGAITNDVQISFLQESDSVCDIDFVNIWTDILVKPWNESLYLDSTWITTISLLSDNTMFDYDGLPGDEMVVTEAIYSSEYNNTVSVMKYDSSQKEWNRIAAMNLSFSVRQLYIAVADFNDDSVWEYLAMYRETTTSGSMKLVICHEINKTLTPITNNVTFADGIYFLEIADVDSDGIKELALSTGFSDSRVCLYKFDGSNLALNWSKTYGSSFMGDLAIGNLDNDTEVELAVSNQGTFEVFDWTGSTFTSKWSTSGSASRSLLIYDYNRDGQNEIVRIDWYTNSKYIYTLEWDGATFNLWTSALYSSDIVWLEQVTNKTSHEQDLVLVQENGIALATWNGTSFHTYAKISLTLYENLLASVGDVDSDLIDEIVVLENTEPRKCHLFEYQSYPEPAQYFSLPLNWTTANRGFKGHYLYDYDGVPGDELFLTPTENYNHTLTIWKYDKFSREWILFDTLFINVTGLWSYVAPTDLDSDGIIDYLVKTRAAAGSTTYLQVYHREGVWLQPLSARITYNDDLYDLDSYDVTGNGIKEVAVATAFSDSSIYFYKFNGTDLNLNWSHTYGSTALTSIDIGELDGDAQPELVVTMTGATIATFDWTGTTFTSKWSQGVGESFEQVFIFDNDGDGDNEIVGSTRIGSPSYIHVYNWTGSSFYHWQSSGYSPIIKSISPFWNNETGTLDLALNRESGVFLASWNSTGFDVYDQIVDTFSGNVPSAIASGDIDADNITEIVPYEVSKFDSSEMNFYVINFPNNVPALLDTTGPTIQVSRSPITPDHNEIVSVNATVTDSSGVSIAILSYSVDGGSVWNNITMVENVNWTADIPGQITGTTVWYRAYANDTLDNWNVVGDYSYLVGDEIPPSVSADHSPASPDQDDIVTVTAVITDTSGVSIGILSYSIDGGSIWTNETMIESGDWTANIPAHDSDTTVWYKVYANDTFDNWNVTEVYSYIVLDTAPPTITVSRNPVSPDQDSVVEINATVTDSTGITNVILSYSVDGGSIWTNITMTDNGNYTAEIPAQTSGTTVWYRVYANDTLDNWNTDGDYSYVVGDTEGPTIDTEYSPSDPDQDDVVTVSAVVSDSSGVSHVILSYSIDGGTIWTNVTMVLGVNWTAGIPAQSSDVTVWYRVYANDTDNFWNSTGIFTYEILDTIAPEINLYITPLTPSQNDTVTISATITDSSVIEGVILSYSFDGGTHWTNVSMTDSGGGLYTGFIPQQAAGVIVNYKVYAVDGAGIWSTSSESSYTVIDTLGPTIVVEYTPTTPDSGDLVVVFAEVNDTSGVTQVILSYSLDNGISWTNVTMGLVEGDWVGTIPAQPDSTIVHLIVYAQDGANNWNASILQSYSVSDGSTTTTTTTTTSTDTETTTTDPTSATPAEGILDYLLANPILLAAIIGLAGALIGGILRISASIMDRKSKSKSKMTST